jgi:alanine-synthesizing transaminase
MVNSDFYRVARLPPYVFNQVNAVKEKARSCGIDIIDLGMGNPDMPPPAHILEKLRSVIGKPGTDRYSVSKGILGLRRAQSDYYRRRFGVITDPDTQVVVTIGSKEGFANLAEAVTAPGDVFLVPDPSYPIHAFGFIIAGGVIRSTSVEPDSRYFSGLELLVKSSRPKPVAVVVCYPSNPTARVASLDFYRDLVAFVKKHDMLIFSDLAYAEIYFGDEPPHSVLEVNGAIDVTVEFTSMSKTFSMAGWRVGFAVGNERLCAALSRVKSYLDYGIFTPIQVSATTALNEPGNYIEEVRSTYRQRRDVMVESFGQAGWAIPASQASLFIWAPVPEKYAGTGSLEFSKILLEEAHVATAPGIGFGERGEGFVRLALVENEQRIRQAARNIKGILHTTKLF